MKGIIILIVMVVVITFFCGFLPGIQQQVLGIPKAVPPIIALPGERLSAAPIIDLPGIYNDVYLTNTLLATWIAYGILILLAVVARLGLRENPRGIPAVMEMAVEGLYNIAEGVVGGRWAKTVFPVAATIFVLILVANWMEMIPGVDSFGLLHHAEAGHVGWPAKELGSTGIYYLDAMQDVVAAPEGEESEAEEHEEEGGELNLAGPFVVTPFVRPAATDINFPLGLAIVTFTFVQILGVVALGWHYPAKFINTPALARGGMGYMDFGVGLLELVLEPVKMVSLTFRLLGNIFGGAVLLIVVSTLAPFLAFLLPTGLYLYEMFVGAIQAYVFFMLTLVYSNVAMSGHGGDDEHH